ncbi:MAG TPA: heavy metal translocating P-type ATPase [Clostridia bacterium]|nr:heavy metal translocating P-type ATPase [Clostridia bacterium]
MEREYLLEGLCCANCAGKIEAAVRAREGVRFAAVNMINTTLRLDADAGAGDLTEEIKSIVRRIEPDIEVIEKDARAPKAAKARKASGMDREKLQLLLGAAVFALGIALRLDDRAELALFLVSYVLLGWKVVYNAIRNLFGGKLFDENFLMTVATVGAFALGDAPEAAGVMLFYQIGEAFQKMAVRRSRKSISDLMDIRPDFANIEAEGQVRRVSPESVRVGDRIIVRPGEKIPLDGEVLDGESMLDTRALTGESVPRSARAGDAVLSGCINQSGVLRIRVTKTFGDSTVAKIMDLVENSAIQKAPTENFITTFSRYYTPAVVGIAALLAIVPPLLLNAEWAEWIHRGLVFLVISCPCALVISIPLGFFGGIGGASKRGVLVKGGNFLEALNKLDIVVFDKTGTLTRGVFEVSGIAPAQGRTKEELLAAAAHAEAHSSHPIAASIRRAYAAEIDPGDIKEYEEIAGHGVRALVKGSAVLAGNGKLMQRFGIAFREAPGAGTAVYLAIDGAFAGSISISDEIKPDSAAAIHGLKAMGVRRIAMLTGDDAGIAAEIARQLGVDEMHAQLLPADKVEKLAALDRQKRAGRKLAFVGDGINDAPVLAMADVGIAMGGLGSDAAIEAADVVLMTDEPSKLIDAIQVARYTKAIVWQNILFALGIKGLFLILGAFGIATMWEAVFADVGVTVLAILNAMRAIRIK